MARAALAAIGLGSTCGALTALVVPAHLELGVWVVLAAALGALAARRRTHVVRVALVCGVVAGMAVTVVHLALFDAYASSHRAELDAMAPFVVAGSMQLTLLVVALGALTALCAWVVTRVWRFDARPAR